MQISIITKLLELVLEKTLTESIGTEDGYTSILLVFPRNRNVQKGTEVR